MEVHRERTMRKYFKDKVKNYPLCLDYKSNGDKWPTTYNKKNVTCKRCLVKMYMRWELAP